MARKVFISFLGTNNYVECHYNINDKLSEPVRFVQEALISHFCKDWTEDDRIYIFCTTKKDNLDGSKEKNWLDNGQSRAENELEKIGLEHRLYDLRERILLKPKIEEVDIDTGFTEEETWSIFDTVYQKLMTRDEIYFDVTHAFRSIPLFSMVLFNYCKFMKNTNVVSVVYGAFEKLGPATLVKKIPLEKRIAQVLDLTNIVRLQEYNQIASDLKKYGKIKSITRFINEQSGNEADNVIHNFCDSIAELDNYITTIDINNIYEGKYVQKFRSNYKSLKKKKKVARPIIHILDNLQEEMSLFKPEKNFDNLDAAIHWTIKYGMLTQAYPLTQEYVILRISDYFRGLKPKRLSNKDFRMFISDILGMPIEDYTQKNWKGKVSENPTIASTIADNQYVQEIRPLYSIIREVRNSLAHGNGSFSFEELPLHIHEIEQCLDYVKKIPKELPHLFLNLSNHPSEQWSDKQLAAALKYGDIEDMEFPAIPPGATGEELMNFAEKTAEEILQKAENADITVHVMGEMTFTYRLVSLLKAEGITCVASTTERIVEEKDGLKTSEFRFVKFREY